MNTVATLGETRACTPRLDDEVEQTLVKCIRNARGAEICGYLLENAHGKQRFLAIENRLASREGVFISAIDQERALRIICSRDLRILAWVHSHDVGTNLSEVDVQYLATGGISWIVVCLSDKGLLATMYKPSRSN